MAVGKTSILTRFISNKFQRRYKATIGADFFVQEIIIDDVVVVLQIWDTAGQERFRSLGSSYFHGADICCVVFDVTSMETFLNVTMWRDFFLSQVNIDDVESFPFIIIGNKVDTSPENRVIDEQQAIQYCERMGNPYKYFDASAKTYLNLDEIFTAVATLALERKHNQAPEPPQPLLEQQKSGCCSS
ncbi:MAG: putative GTP-binding protein ypt7 [Streblomastix strix]|uniref:Putative GTP-binding protein ypt7 n=1 Tax=Streblomastix strix TaxID=222440 RepID=A0A5J4X4N5_9EUKA|nr:MAG: putative GTP-binding protein ypt7 [Streblomastix strix]